MKTLDFLLLSVCLMFSCLASAEVEVKQAPLTWKQASITDGGELFAELCAACHGKEGKGDGPVAASLKNAVPNLTLLAANNEGTFPYKATEDSIVGKNRVASHGTVDMPVWGAAFEGVRPDWKQYRREALAKQRIHNLVEYISTIQVK